MGAAEIADPVNVAAASAVARSAGAVEIEIRLVDRSYAHLRVCAGAAQQARLVTTLSMHGQRHPVVVVPRAGGRYALIDGHRRVDGLARLGRDTVTALVLDLEESEALAYCHRMEATGRRSPL